MYAECSRMFQNVCRMFQNVSECQEDLLQEDFRKTSGRLQEDFRKTLGRLFETSNINWAPLNIISEFNSRISVT